MRTAYCAYEFHQNGPSPLTHDVTNILILGFTMWGAGGGGGGCVCMCGNKNVKMFHKDGYLNLT
jgi:hypothetical protein